MSLGFGLTTAAATTAACAATVAVRTLGEIITPGLGAAIVADLAPAHLRGRYSGAYGAVWSAAYLIGPADHHRQSTVARTAAGREDGTSLNAG